MAAANDQSFINQLRREPAHDELQLEFADWMEERGESDLAKFLRLEVFRRGWIWGRRNFVIRSDSYRDPNIANCRWNRRMEPLPKKVSSAADLHWFRPKPVVRYIGCGTGADEQQV